MLMPNRHFQLEPTSIFGQRTLKRIGKFRGPYQKITVHSSF